MKALVSPSVNAIGVQLILLNACAMWCVGPSTFVSTDRVRRFHEVNSAELTDAGNVATSTRSSFKSSMARSVCIRQVWLGVCRITVWKRNSWPRLICHAALSVFGLAAVAVALATCSRHCKNQRRHRCAYGRAMTFGDWRDDAFLQRRPSVETLAWVAASMDSGSRVVGHRRLTGGVCSAVHRLTV